MREREGKVIPWNLDWCLLGGEMEERQYQAGAVVVAGGLYGLAARCAEVRSACGERDSGAAGGSRRAGKASGREASSLCRWAWRDFSEAKKAIVRSKPYPCTRVTSNGDKSFLAKTTKIAKSFAQNMHYNVSL